MTRCKTIMAAIAICMKMAASGEVADYRFDWWKDVVLEPTPTNDLQLADSTLFKQDKVARHLANSGYEASDAVAATNLWRMLAFLHGDLREKKVEPPPDVILGFHIVNDKEKLARMIEENDRNIAVCSYQISRQTLERHVREAIVEIAASEAVASFPAAERNAMTSNIVALARFDAEEAAGLGLTNVVDKAEK